MRREVLRKSRRVPLVEDGVRDVRDGVVVFMVEKVVVVAAEFTIYDLRFTIEGGAAAPVRVVGCMGLVL